MTGFCLRTPSKRSGMILLVVVGVLIFTIIAFTSMIDRVRKETGLTAKNSVNEELYQLALGLGRLAVSKLKKDIQNKDISQKEICDAIFNGTPLKNKTYENLKETDVINRLSEKYTDLQTEVVFSIDFDSQGFASSQANSLTGLVSPPLERKGTLTVRVTVTAKKQRRSCWLINQFFVVRLLPSPYHKFTLFCTQGAALKPEDVNRIEKLDDDGKTEDANPPLVLFNCPVDLTKNEFDFTNLQVFKSNFKPKELMQRGWVYLGGEGQSISKTNPEKYLALNICAGEKEGGSVKDKYFGEGFHFYFDNKTNGWRFPGEWNAWMSSVQPSLDGYMVIILSDYGIFKGLFTDQYSHNGKPLYTETLKANQTSSNPILQGQVWDKTNALHLFGTPTSLTPTLVFGPVKRRYLRTYAFYFEDIEWLYPIRLDMAPYWAPGFPNGTFFDKELFLWLNENHSLAGEPPCSLEVDDFLKKITIQNFAARDSGRDPIPPTFIDSEAYIEGMKNIACPDDPTKTLEEIIPEVMSIYPKDEIAKKDFQFLNDKQLNYSGRINELAKLPADYLAPKVSYYLKDPSKVMNIVAPNSAEVDPQCQFLFDKQILIPDPTGNRLIMYLDQVIKVDGDINIRYPIRVQRGGIILCDGKITLYEPVHNLFKADPTLKLNDDDFGFVTLVAKNGIVIKSRGFRENLPNQLYPEIHAILVSLADGKGNIEVDGPVHIKGSVVLDRLDLPAENNLLACGGIIEWGFDPNEFSSGDPISARSYYGFAMGPKDYEIVLNE
ncbi:MAG: hypothetical protein HQM10_18965 [Candidatus Riflebacteria bacterium]|nr:hypothetical protein [Candidatus Riflebacteria bacterium]